MAKPPGPRTAGRARWRVQTISAGNFWRKAEFTSAAQVQSIRGSPRRAKPCGGVILHSLAPQLRLRKIPDFQRLFIILLNIEVCKLIFWGRRPWALQVGPGAWGRYCVPCGWVGLLRGLGAQRPVARPAPGGGPAFFGRKPEERTPGRKRFFLPGPTFSGWGDPAGGSFFFAWPAALYLTPVTARPPAGRAGRGQEFWDPLRWAPKIGG